MATTPAPQRSLFVTNLAWFLMAIGALSVLAGLAQIVMTVVMDAVPLLKEAQDKQFESLGNWFFYGFYALHVVVSALASSITTPRRFRMKACTIP